MAVPSDVGSKYRDEGYYIVPDLFTRPEVERWKQEIRSILDDVREEMRQKGEDPARRLISGVYVGLAVRSPLFRDLARDPRLLDYLEPMIGPNIAFFSDKIVFKDHTTDFGSPWHQDWPYWKGSHKISIWIALDDATEENGCLMVVPGSHKDYVEHGHKDDQKGFVNRIDPESIDQDKVVTAAIPAGGAIFFHDLTLHSSHPNRSGADRWALISTYRDAKAEDPVYDFAKAAAVVRGEGRP